MLYYLMLHYFDIALFDVRYLMLSVPHFHIVLFAVAIVVVSLFNVALL